MFATAVTCDSAPQRVVLTGTVLDCRGGHTPGEQIFVFRRSQQLDHVVELFEKASDDNIFDRFDGLISYLKGPGALARTKTDRGGYFRVEISPAEKIAVFGYMETEDNPPQLRQVPLLWT
jgi:hypothetical protein